MKRRPDTVRAGFTLIELIMVVAVLAILMSIAIPRMGWGTIGKVQAESAARNFSGHLKLARSLAISNAGSNSGGYKVVLTGTGTSRTIGSRAAGYMTFYTLTTFTSYSLINAATSGTVKGRIEIPEGVTCVPPILGRRTKVFHFTPLGTLEGETTETVRFTKSDYTAAVTVTAVGRITTVIE